MLKEITIAIQAWDDARRLIRTHKLFRWIVIPGIIYTVLFIVGMYFFWSSSNDAVTWISDQLRIESWLQQKRSEWLSFFFLMAGMMLRLVLVLFYFSLFKYLILVIGSPVFAYLSEKTEAIIYERPHRFNWRELKKDAWRGIRLAFRNAGWQSFYLFLLALLSLVPFAGWITPIIALLMECYYFGFSMLDYSFARNNFTPTQSVAFTGTHKGLAIGNGILFYLMHVLIILAPAYAIIAATLTVHRVKMGEK
ncbi:MAG TPA: EI24 domain-containing protein [Chitinophagaceae bacterium]|nr:EI24 domain-containing protein [Chitinophagaceae bacterium]